MTRKKCLICGNEVEASAKFCPYCGSSFARERVVETPDTETLVKIAEGYTGNRKVAKEFVEQIKKANEPVRGLRKLCVGWIRERNRNLFKDVVFSEDSEPELTETDPVLELLNPLDYEERIVALMMRYEHLTALQIGMELGIGEDYVHALLQKAYAKNHAVEAADDILEDAAGDTVGLTKQTWIPRVVLIGSLVALSVLGIFIGVRSYATRKYLDAVALVEQENYTDALKKLESAVRWGGGGDEALLLLGDVLFEQQDYSSALVRYEDYYAKVSNDEAVRKISDCCEKLADELIEAGELKRAEEYLQKEYVLSESPIAYVRVQALHNNDRFTDGNGNVWDSYGHLLRLTTSDLNKDVLYQIDITYDDNRHWKTMTATGDKLRGTNANVFSFDDGVQYTMTFVKSIGSLYAQQERDVYNEAGMLLNRKTVNRGVTNTWEYIYQYDENGSISGALIVQNTSDGRVEMTAEYENGVPVRIESDTEVTVYTYDADQRCLSVVTSENGSEVLKITNQYDEEGHLLKTTEERSTDWVKNIPGGTYREFVYTWGSGRICSVVVTDRDGRQIGQGIYVRDNGMIFAYDRSE